MLLDAARTVSIGSFLLVTAMVAGCVAVGTFQPAVGIFAAVISAIALIRTALYVTYHKAAGRRLAMGAKVIGFIHSAVFISLLMIAAALAFCFVCIPMGALSSSLTIGVALGSLAAIVLVAVVLWNVPVYR